MSRDSNAALLASQVAAMGVYAWHAYHERRLRAVLGAATSGMVDEESGLLSSDALRMRATYEIAWARDAGRNIAIGVIELWPRAHDTGPTLAQVGRVRQAMRSYENAYLLDDFTI